MVVRRSRLCTLIPGLLLGLCHLFPIILQQATPHRQVFQTFLLFKWYFRLESHLDAFLMGIIFLGPYQMYNTEALKLMAKSDVRCLLITGTVFAI
jgi:hypothetical protein